MERGAARGRLQKSQEGPQTESGEGEGDALTQRVKKSTSGVNGGEMEVTSSAGLQVEERLVPGVVG